MTYVVTYFDVQPDSTPKAMSLITEQSRLSRAEKGNAAFDAFQEISRPNRLVSVEAWTDESSFQTNEASAHTTQFRTRLKAIHNSPFDQRLHHDFAVGSAARPAGSDGLFVVTHVDVPPPRREETEALLRRLAEESRLDEGSVRYDVFQQSTRTNHFTVFAVWSGEAAFTDHIMKTHTRQFRDSLGPMLGAPYDERLYRSLQKTFLS